MPIGSDKGSFIKPGFLPLTVGPEGPTAAQAWAWGLNNVGSLGLGDTTNRSSPVQIGTEANWSSLSNGHENSLGVKTEGSLYAWGGNNYGELGQGNTINYSSPVQVGALTDWLKATASYDGGGAIKTDGTLWTWGRGTYGALAQGNTWLLYTPDAADDLLCVVLRSRQNLHNKTTRHRPLSRTG